MKPILSLPAIALAVLSPAPAALAANHAARVPLSVSSDTIWVNAHTTNACPGSLLRGGEATGGPDGFETWCFEGGSGDSTSGGGPAGYVFSSYDRRRMRDDNDSLYWHADTFQAIAGTSMWCGGWNDRCGSWLDPGGGYANDWQQIMQLTLPGPFNAANGCSLQFRARYTLYCRSPFPDVAKDFGHLEYYSYRRNEWRILDVFNGKSGCTVVPEACYPDWNNYRYHDSCPGLPYGQIVNYPGSLSLGSSRDFPGYPYVRSNSWLLIPGDSISATPASIPELRFRWRMSTGAVASTAEGTSGVHGMWVDDVKIKVGAFSYNESFDGVPVGNLPGAPWSFPPIEPIYDGWAIRHDLDPPLEGIIDPGPGDIGFPSGCRVDGSWQWSIVGNGGPIAPPDTTSRLPGYYVVLASPAIPLTYADEEGGPFVDPRLVVQFDEFANLDPDTCDRVRLRVRVHRTGGLGSWAATGAWCGWEEPPLGYLLDEGQTYVFDQTVDLTGYGIPADADSIQVAWVSYDVGPRDDHFASCWNPVLPPHIGTQYIVDNVSLGFRAGDTPVVYGSLLDGLFQDTFNVHSCLHTARVSNAQLAYGPYLLANASESLNIQITDPDGLSPGSVRLHYSYDGFASEAPGSPAAMHLSEPDPEPGSGGIWRGTICDTPWTAGTEVSYFLTVEDDLGNVAYVPGSAGPASVPRTFLTVDILPTAGAKILLVDDAGEEAPLYHPCRQDTVTLEVEEFYASILRDLGYGFMQPGGYDLYDVNAPSAGQRITEPWGFWTADPAAPDSGSRTYDTVIWTTGTRNYLTIQDTTQTFLKQFVFHGGRVLVSGDRASEYLARSDYGQDPDFLGNLLGAEWISSHPSGFTDPDRFPKKAAGAPGSTLTPGDSLHLFVGCDNLRFETDKVRMKTAGLPPWSHPRIYLRYDDATSPYDSLAGIYNFTTFTADTGRVVYLPFSLDAVVDRHRASCDPPDSPFGSVGPGTFYGQAELVKEILEVFGASPRTSVSEMTGGELRDFLHPILPNPVRGPASIRFSLAAPAHVTMSIYDVTGRRVAMMIDRNLEAGEHAMQWNGRDGSGRETAPGIYFARLETTRFTKTEKLLVVR